MLNIDNIRLGHACNSSSSHSIIITDGKTKYNDEDIYDEGEFGWNEFIIASEQMKTLYSALILHGSLVGLVGDSYANDIVKNITKIDIKKDMYIDHQSRFQIPCYYNKPNVPNKEYFEELAKFIKQKNVVILGGNDNSESYKTIPGTHIYMPDGDNSVCRKDNDYWVIFNKQTGNKVRFAFNDSKFKRPTRPELVDLKITNRCHTNCEYCYMDSKPDSLHANLSEIHKTLYALSDLEVFEIALGGGEVTLHPHLDTIIRDAKHLGITPSFTTRNMDWVKENVHLIKDIGAIAFTVTSVDDAKKLLDIKKEYSQYIRYNQFHVQIVMGTVTRAVYNDIIDSIGSQLPIILVGYKSTGRGKSYTPLNYDWWLDDIVKLKTEKNLWLNIGVDTCLIENYQSELEKHNIPGLLYNIEEGKHSCFIDVVERKIGKSSFCDKLYTLGSETGKFYDNYDDDRFTKSFSGYTDLQTNIKKFFNDIPKLY